MTTPARRTLLLGLLTAVLAGVLVPSLLGAAKGTWNAKVDTTRYERDRLSDSLRLQRIEETLVDVLCAPTIQPEHRRCR